MAQNPPDPSPKKAREQSSINVLKYGLAARTVVLPNENGDEHTLVLEMVNAKWRGPALWNRDRKEALQRRLYNAANESYSESYCYATNTLRSLQRLRESKPDAGRKDRAKRTESQVRTPSESKFKTQHERILPARP